MEKNKWIKFGVSAVLALIIVKVYIVGLVDKKLQQFTMTDVVCTSRDIPAGTLLQATDLQEVPIPNRYVQPTAFVSKLPGQGFARVAGQTAVIVIPSNTQILQSMLGRPETKTVDHVIPPGKRAYPLVVPRSEVTRLINVGTRIDLIANLPLRDSAGERKEMAKTILQDIVVLSVRNELLNQIRSTTHKTSEEGTLITLAVSPAEAEQLSLAEKASQGDIRITIRPYFESSR
jgi:Flp pilus assembly protein CpaB